MKINLEGKKAFICSSSRGLGFSTAKILHNAGADIYIHGSKDSTAISAKEKILQLNSSSEGSINTIGANLYNEKEVIEVAKEISSINPDILILNSGGPAAGGFESLIEQSALEKEINMITSSAIQFINSAIEGMKIKKSGRIINISSIGLIKPIPVLAASNAARSMLHGLMVGMSSEYGEYNITFNTVCPGIIMTDRQTQLAEYDSRNQGISIDEVFKNKSNMVPNKRMGDPEDIGSLICFLASDMAAYITSQKIAVDGGLLGVF